MLEGHYLECSQIDQMYLDEYVTWISSKYCLMMFKIMSEGGEMA